MRNAEYARERAKINSCLVKITSWVVRAMTTFARSLDHAFWSQMGTN